MSDKRLYLYPLWLRIWHGVNALCIIMLGITGLSMQYTDLEAPLLGFKYAVTVHNFFGILTLVSYFFFFLANIYTGNVRFYNLRFKGMLTRLILQGKYYVFGYLKGETKPFPVNEERKFNPLQKVSYVATMYILVPFVVISGIALLFPEMIIEKIYNMSGIRITTFLHSLVGFFILIFLIIHLYVITIGKHPLRNFKSMINGYHEAE